MDSSTHKIAVIAGMYLLITGLGFLFSRRFYEKMIVTSSTADPMLINLSGAVHLIVGLLMLYFHAGWSSVAAGGVTITGGLAAIKGTILIIIPEVTIKSSSESAPSLLISMAVFLIGGSILMTAGFNLFSM